MVGNRKHLLGNRQMAYHGTTGHGVACDGVACHGVARIIIGVPSILALTVGLMICGGKPAIGQTVSSVSPLVSSGNYTVSSSPLPNGGRVNSVYYPPQSRQLAPHDGGATSGYGQVNRVATLPAGYPTADASPTYDASGTRVSGQRATYVTNDGWQSVNTTSQVVTTRYQQPTNMAPQLQSVPQNQSPVARSSTPTGSTYYDQRTTASFQGGTPAASTQPSLNPMNPSGTYPSNTVVQGSTPSNIVTTQPQNGLNWQQVGGATYPSGYRYTPAGVCTPVNAQYINTQYANASCGPYRPYTTYKPLLPLRRMPGNAYLGQGLYGQPKAYVEGENVRNFFRYVLP